jgi:hypothetical protein
VIRKGPKFVLKKPGVKLSCASVETSELGKHGKMTSRTNCERCTDYVTLSLRWDHAMKCLNLTKSPSVYGQLRWCVKVGATVLDFGIADEEVVDIQLIEHEDYNGDDPASCISIRVTDWKVILINVFREEKALKSLMQETEEDDYTYDHLEDSLRDMRHQHFRSRLDPNEDEDGSRILEMDHMRPLWGKYSSVSVNPDYDDIERAERNAVRTLKLIRREASMTVRERDALDLIVVKEACSTKNRKSSMSSSRRSRRTCSGYRI